MPSGVIAAKAGARREDGWWTDPDEVILIEDPTHPMYDPRIEHPIDPLMLSTMLGEADEIHQNVLLRRRQDNRSECVFGTRRIRTGRLANRVRAWGWQLRRAPQECGGAWEYWDPRTIDGSDRVGCFCHTEVPLLPEGQERALPPLRLRFRWAPTKATDRELFTIKVLENAKGVREAEAPLDLAWKFNKLHIHYEVPVAEIADGFGYTEMQVRNYLRLHALSEPVRKAVADGKIRWTYAIKLFKTCAAGHSESNATCFDCTKRDVEQARALDEFLNKKGSARDHARSGKRPAKQLVALFDRLRAADLGGEGAAMLAFVLGDDTALSAYPQLQQAVLGLKPTSHEPRGKKAK